MTLGRISLFLFASVCSIGGVFASNELPNEMVANAFNDFWAGPKSDEKSNASQEVIPPSYFGLMPGQKLSVVSNLEFLFWTSQIENSSYAVLYELFNKGRAPPNQFELDLGSIERKEFGTSWNPGSRVGLGIIFQHDEWDLYTDWTYFANNVTSSHSVPGFQWPLDLTLAVPPNSAGVQVLSLNAGILASADMLADFLFDHITAKYYLLFNQIDIKLGSNIKVKKYLNIHPFVGLRGHWSTLHWQNVATSNFTNPGGGGNLSTILFKIGIKQHLWALGVVLGANSGWYFTRNWSFIANSSASLCYGHFRIRKRNTDLAITVTQSLIDSNVRWRSRYDFYGLQPAIDLDLGVAWEELFLKEAIHLKFSLKWETHYLIAFNKSANPIFRDGPETTSSADYGGLALAGIVARCEVKF